MLLTLKITDMDIKQIKLNSLLEVTQAINSNMSEDDLYRIFYFICMSTIKFEKYALIVFEEEELVVKVEHGFKVSETNLDRLLANHNVLNGIDDILPIAHNKTVLAYILIAGGEHAEDRKDYISFLKTLANIIMVAIENKRLARKQIEQQAFKKEMEIARTVQSMLVLKSFPKSEHISIDAFYLPYKAIGGDYYDYIQVSDSLNYVCIADVSGKGMPAALLMSNFQACLRTMVSQTNDLKKIITELNRQLLHNSQGEYFVTFFIAELNFETGVMEYVNAGHNPIYYKRKGKIEELKKGSTILGAFDHLPFLEIGETVIEKDAVLVCYTDGVTEIKNTEEEEWGEENLKECLLNYSPENDLSVIDKVLKGVDNFRGSCGYSDDLTLMVCAF